PANVACPLSMKLVEQNLSRDPATIYNLVQRRQEAGLVVARAVKAGSSSKTCLSDPEHIFRKVMQLATAWDWSVESKPGNRIALRFALFNRPALDHLTRGIERYIVIEQTVP